MPEADYYFHGLPRPGSLFFHPPQEVHIPSFDQKSPFKPSFAWLVTEAVPSGRRTGGGSYTAWRRWIRRCSSTAAGCLPLGQEDAMRNVAAAYRRLPAVRFAAAGPQGHAGGSQPVTLRCGQRRAAGPTSTPSTTPRSARWSASPLEASPAVHAPRAERPAAAVAP